MLATQIFARFARETALRALPAEVQRHTQRAVVDWYASLRSFRNASFARGPRGTRTGDPVHDDLACLIVRCESAAMDAGRLWPPPQALGVCVVLAVALPRYGTANAPGLEGVHYVQAAVLATAIAVEDLARCRFTAEAGYQQGVVD